MTVDEARTHDQVVSVDLLRPALRYAPDASDSTVADPQISWVTRKPGPVHDRPTANYNVVSRHIYTLLFARNLATP
jgi:hypothetical protein